MPPSVVHLSSTRTDRPALLALADGSVWPGLAFGTIGQRIGEVVFNTSMSGYQEILTDPSYHGQIVVMTQPHIGNYGVNEEDDESHRSWVAGFVVRDASPIASNWRASRTLHTYLNERGIVGITGVDTRTLVRHIRTHGAMNAAVSSQRPEPDDLVALARSAPDMNGLDLVKEVTCAEPYHWDSGIRDWGSGLTNSEPTHDPLPLIPRHVVAYDYGIKRNILRRLAAHGCRVTVVPAQTPAAEVLALEPDGVLLSNGPGDPAAVTYAVENIQKLLGHTPIFGICLGHQLLGLALGGRTYKLKFGHRGGNQPVKHLPTGRVEISSHNHGFAVRAESLPVEVEVTRVNLNDGCLEGFRAPSLDVLSVQYHPEASPGPHDSDPIFHEFIALMQTKRKQ